MQDEYSDLDTRIQAFRESDVQREQLLFHLLQRLRTVEKNYQALSNDYENERVFRRHWQDKHDGVEKNLIYARQVAENNCFVQVLIDGDAAYFHESAIKEGEKGGARTSAELFVEIKKHVETLFPGHDLPIILHMYANLGGMSAMLMHNKVIASQSELYMFARGFNNTQDMFNLVDVGAGKENADHKLKELFKIFLANKQCKHLIFAGCHDNGYLNILRPRAHDPEMIQRITLLETLPAQPGFRELDHTMISFPTIFKSEAIKPILVETPKAIPARVMSPSTPVLASAPTTPKAPGSWSAKAATNGTHVIDVSSSKSKSMKFYLLNAEQHRVDEKLAVVPQSFNEALKKKRDLHGNLCNDYYLRGECPNKEFCNYVHDVRLSTGELSALRGLARNLTCGESSWCEDFRCYKGHVCPYEAKGKTCMRENNCYFYEMHGTDLHPAVKVYEDGRRENIK